MARIGRKETYGLSHQREAVRVPAPRIAYRPKSPKRDLLPIGLIGCGGIAEQHLTAYRKAGYNVVALCDINRKAVESRRQQFYPDARVYTDYRKLIAREEVSILDISPHPDERVPIIEAALNARRHVLSQKPFVLDLAVGKHLADLAEKNGVQLAVNQNGRWAPHFSWMRGAIDQGLIGKVVEATFSVHWNHNWVAGTKFDRIRHLVLYDFAVHWFDMTTVFFGERKAERVTASIRPAANQTARPALLAHAVIDYADGQATLSFNGSTSFGQSDTTIVVGDKGTLVSTGLDLMQQKVTLYKEGATCSPRLAGHWFPDGFHGTMAELMAAIAEGREPIHSARNNLRTLELCFAAVASADEGKPKKPGSVKGLRLDLI